MVQNNKLLLTQFLIFFFKNLTVCNIRFKFYFVIKPVISFLTIKLNNNSKNLHLHTIMGAKLYLLTCLLLTTSYMQAETLKNHYI